MLPFHDRLNSDNPVSDDINPEELHIWYVAFILIGSNFFGLPLLFYAHRNAFFVLSATTLGAVFVSVLYHTCQTTDVCFGFELSRLTQADHMTAPIFMVAIILFFINSRGTRQMVYTRELRRAARPPPDAWVKHARPLGALEGEVPEPWYDESFYLTDNEFGEAQDLKVYYNVGYSKEEPNTLSNAWDVYSLFTLLFVVILSTLAHPFSMQAFIIVICFGLAIVFYKIVIIEEGVPVNMYQRVYLPDLVLGVVMLFISLVFYVLDSYVAYPYFHSLWHILSFLGGYYMTIGLSRNVEGWYSPTYWLYTHTVSCCLKQEVEPLEEMPLGKSHYHERIAFKQSTYCPAELDSLSPKRTIQSNESGWPGQRPMVGNNRGFPRAITSPYNVKSPV